MEIDVYSFENYRAFLKARVKADKNNWGLWAKLAKAAGCQATYLTQAMRGKANLTADHILGIAQFWNFSTEEIEFFLLLLDLEKAATPKLKNFIQNKIKKIKMERENLAKRLALPRLEIGQTETLYYSAWYFAALHVIVTIPEFQTSSSIASRLQLPIDAVENALQQLSELKIVKKEGSHWKLATADIHIPKNSPLIGMHHNNWRQRAVQNSTLYPEQSVHYTAVYSISQQDFKRLKEKMTEFIAYTRKVVAPSKEEKLVCMTCDFFEV